MELSELSALIAEEIPTVSIREEIKNKTADFLNSGGKIKQIDITQRSIDEIMQQGNSLEAMEFLS